MSAIVDLISLAREIARAQDAAAPLVPLTDRFPGFDLPQAYAVARLVRDARRTAGRTTLGRKIGFTNAKLWPTYGVHHPIWGWMYDSTVVQLEEGKARCSLRGLAEPRIEPEIVFGLRSAPAGADAASVLAAIDWVAHGFEIVQSHYPGWKFRAADTVADGGLHGKLLLGRRVPVAELGPGLVAQLQSFTLALSCQGEEKEVGRGAHVLGSPLAALGHLVDVLRADGEAEPLQPGEMVTTGTVTHAYPIAGGEIWRSALNGLGLPGLEIEFTR